MKSRYTYIGKPAFYTLTEGRNNELQNLTITT